MKNNSMCLNEDVNGCDSTVLSLVDRLKAKRSRIAQKANREVKELDRQIQLLIATNSENIVNEAEQLLYSE